jgi:F420H(2)-dependent quinone reductase
MYLYLTTIGRVTGQPREIEIWFTEHVGHFDLVAERKSANWVRNIQSQPRVKVRVIAGLHDQAAESGGNGCSRLIRLRTPKPFGAFRLLERQAGASPAS